MKRVAVYCLIALALVIYIMIVITVGSAVLPDHWAAQLLFYGVTGIIWIFPLMKIIEFFYKRSNPEA